MSWKQPDEIIASDPQWIEKQRELVDQLDAAHKERIALDNQTGAKDFNKLKEIQKRYEDAWKNLRQHIATALK